MNNKMEIELIGFGYVVTDKVVDSMEVDIYPVSTIPTADGDLSKKEEMVSTNTDLNGLNVNVKINKQNMITAMWLNEGHSNQLCAPSVCQKEIVKLYKIAGIDIYWWDTIYSKPEFRKREKSLKFFSSKSDIDESGYLKKGYFFLVDTFKKVLHLHTSDDDGEYTTYDSKLDTKAGYGQFIDGKGNSLTLKSTEDGFIIKTNSYVRIETENAFIDAKGEVNVKADKSVTVKAPKISLN